MRQLYNYRVPLSPQTVLTWKQVTYFQYRTPIQYEAIYKSPSFISDLFELHGRAWEDIFQGGVV